MRVTVETAGRSGDAARAAAALGAQHLVVEARTRRGPLLRACRTAIACRGARMPAQRAVRCLTASAGTAVLRERDQCAASLRVADAPGHFKDGFNDYRGRRRRRRGQPAARGHQMRGALPARRCRPVAAPCCGCGCARPTLDGVAVRRLRRRVRAAPTPRPTNSTPRCSADIADPDARLVQRQALAGMLWSKQFYHFDVPRWLRGRSAAAAAARERGGTAATTTGST